MKKKLLTGALLLALIGLSVWASASNLIIDAKTLANELKTNKNMVLIDVMGADVYSKQHIQGAINIPHKSLYKDGPIEGQFKEPEVLADIFAKKGVSNTSMIVVYDDGTQKYNSRVWWVLKYLGAENVVIFHKDAAAMEAARIPMTATATTLKAVPFEVNLKPEMNIFMADLKKKSGNPGFILLDSRERDEYDGADKANRSKGHLPGAIFMNFKEVLTPSNAYKSKEEIISVASKFGVTPDKDIVVYCQTGIKAAVLYIAFKEIAGFENVKIYSGAYAEWASISDNPIVK